MGSAAATALLRDAARNPHGPLHGLVVGPGGTGKSVLLDALAESYARAGVATCRDPHQLPDPAAACAVAVLIDDASDLGEQAQLRLRRLAEDGQARLVVAHRPGPANPAMAFVRRALGRARPPVVLGRLDRDGVAALLGATLDGPPAQGPRFDGLGADDRASAEVVIDFVLAQTAGTPSLVELLVRELRASGALCALSAQGARVPLAVPDSALAQLAFDLDLIAPRVLGLLQALAIGAPWEPDLLRDLLVLDAADVPETAELARGTGLVADDGELVPMARAALLALGPPMRLESLRRRLAGLALAAGPPLLPVARRLVGTGATGREVAALLAGAGAETDQPALAEQLYAAAVQAGAAPLTVAAPRAEAAARRGHLDAALRLADSVISAGEDHALPPGAGDRAVAVAATVLAQRGLLGHSAQLYRWRGIDAGGSSPMAVLALVGTGHLDDARAVLRQAGDGAPTLAGGAETLTAEGILETVTGTPSAALSKLIRAAMLVEPQAGTVLMADTPAALAALVALNCGEVEVARSVLARAVAAGLGGPPARARHRLLQARTGMQRGDLDLARTHLRAAGPALEPREELLASTIEVGLARREGDIGGLVSAWQRARAAIVRHPVDLFALHSLGELAVAAARLGEQSWIAPHLAEGWDLLERLGNPPLWAAPMHWFAVQAAGIAERPADAEPHLRALTRAAGQYPPAAALAAAATCWLHVMAGQVEPAEVQAAARRLQRIGYGWDASRLAGQAAIRTEDKTTMSALLAFARSLRPAGSTPAPGGDAAPASGGAPASDGALAPALPSAPAVDPAAGNSRTGAALPAGQTARPVPADGAGRAATLGRQRSGDDVAAPAPSDAAAAMTDREREVAGLLVTGLTYKEIGERLFISPKTVEHHVAKIRHRLGVTTRSELFSQLRRDFARSADSS